MHIQIKSLPLKIIIFTFPLIFAFVVLWIRFNHFPTYEIIGMEDHIIEYSQFFFFLIGGIIALFTALKIKKSSKFVFVLFLIISLALIFVAGEEISWGERIFNLNAPEVFDGETKIPWLGYNVQGEMNLHNFKPIHNVIGILYMIIGGYFLSAWFLVKIIDRFWKLKEKFKEKLLFFIPNPVLSLYFVPTFINLLDRHKLGFTPQDYEMVEFLLSLGILIFIVMCYLIAQKENKTHL